MVTIDLRFTYYAQLCSIMLLLCSTCHCLPIMPRSCPKHTQHIVHVPRGEQGRSWPRAQALAEEERVRVEALVSPPLEPGNEARQVSPARAWERG